ncbi:MAG TPA: DUF5106 domain-containing protein [Salinivirgaceae bacterium]|nr:DUF5106 domain-containing protein [Salinivirgaceae bacterium]
MRSKLRLLIISILCFTTLYGQYNISVTINGLQDKEIFLAYYFGDKNYVVDTLRLDKKGRGIFTGSNHLDEGIYLIVLPSRNYFDIIIDEDQHFALETDTSSDIRTMVRKLKIEGSEANSEFREYQVFMFDKTKEAHLLKVTSGDKTVSEKRRKKAKSDLEKVNKEILDKQNEIISLGSNKLLSQMIKAFGDPEVPAYGTTFNGRQVDSLFQYNYYKDNYFENVDFSDKRLLKTPVYHTRLVRFFDQVVSPNPDSVISASKRLLNMTEGCAEMFQYTLQFVFNKFSQSKIMGHDKVTVYLADNYYLNGKATWADEEYISKLKDRVDKMRPNVIGADAPRLDKAQTPDGMFYPLHLLNSKIIALVFWEPECGHCKKEIPQMVEIFNKYHQKGFHVYAFYTQSNLTEWKTSISKLGMENFVNVYDPFNFTSFRDTYDVYSTPTLYLLDEDFKILAKRISLESLEEFLEDRLK